MSLSCISMCEELRLEAEPSFCMYLRREVLHFFACTCFPRNLLDLT